MHDRYQEHRETAARTEEKPGVRLALTRRQLLRAGFSVVGAGSALFVDTLLQPNVARSRPVKALPVALRPFHFEVVTVNATGQVVSRQPGTAKFFTEDLGKSVGLDMVSIPGGSFVMGSPASEKERFDGEGPQHHVTVKPFLLGRYAVTQAQWSTVAALPKVKLDLEPDPSFSKGAKHPVERVSWPEAVEFCGRLSAYTGRTYRLPSEAEWEYACRAGTTTPFHFGATLTTDLANYNGELTYAAAPKGRSRKQTTNVGSFPPNAFGLYDMHGNVWEWCLDHFHETYEEAPTDGSAWFESEASYWLRSLRGGAGYTVPEFCRSAFRARDHSEARRSYYGFRVACVAP